MSEINPIENQQYSRSSKKVWAYGSAWLNDSLLFVFFGVVLFYFYENLMLLNLIYITIAYAIFAVWNMVNDPLLSYLSERPRSQKNIMRLGFRYPLILISGVIMTIAFFFLFFTPDFNPQTEQIVIFVYFVILVCILDGFYTIYNANVTAGAVTMFKTENDRRRLAIASTAFATFGVLFVNAILLPMIIGEGYRDKSRYMLAISITAGITMIVYLILSYGLKEPKDVKEFYIVGRQKQLSKEVPFTTVVKTALKKKNYTIFVFTYFLASVAWGLYYASLFYIYDDILRTDYSNAMWPQLAYFITYFIGLIFLVIPLAKKVGTSKLYGIGYILSGCIFLSTLWLQSWQEAVIYMLIAGFCVSIPTSLVFAVLADAYDEITADLGVHQEATLQGITNFFLRFSYFIIAFIIVIVHFLTGYIPGATHQSALAVWGVRIHAGLIPALFLFFAGGLFLKYYDLTGEKKQLIAQRLKSIEQQGKLN